VVTLVIAAGLWVGIHLAGGTVDLTAFDPGRGSLFPALLQLNLVLLGFNLLPAFPMDGGRVLRALLASRKGIVKGTRIAAKIGQFFAMGFGALGLFSSPPSPFLIIIAAFIYLGAEAEAQAVETRAAGRGVTAAGMMVTDLRMLRVYATLEDAVKLLLAGEQREFPIVDNDGRLEGLLTREDLVRGLSTVGPHATVGQVMSRVQEPLAPATPFDTALERLRASGLPALPVVNPERQVIGLLTVDNITDLLLVRRHVPGLP